MITRCAAPARRRAEQPESNNVKEEGPRVQGLSGGTPMSTMTMSTTKRPFAAWTISAAAAALALAPVLLASPASADSAAPARSAHHARMHHARGHVMNSYAAYGAEPGFVEPEWDAPYGDSVYGYNCGIGLMGSPLACEPGD
jgi:hypothetical protein